jgi:DNA-directed RNA polymerase beta subunit
VLQTFSGISSQSNLTISFGRAKTYEAIVKGDNIPKAGVPESFNVLVHELRGLGLDLKFE